MMDIFLGKNSKKRDIATIYYDPMWSDNVSKYRSVFTQDNRYKLYKDGRFFDLENDILEESPLMENSLTKEQKELLNKLDESFSKSKSKHRPNEKSWLDGIKEFFDK